ncbi:MAG: hypothetical protein QFC55_02925 [Chloroflexota bacterium]|nr:hypothetical protein [Chloroflexota bacterium]
MDENQTQTNENMADSGDKPRAGREMLVQLQQMIDTLATQAGPVMREVAAKAAELAAVAGTKAGPLAHRAAGMTEVAGQKLAARSKEVAADLRKPREGAAADMMADHPTHMTGDQPADSPAADPTAADVPYEEMGSPD